MKPAVKWGLILGVSVIAWTLIIHFLGFYTTKLGAGQKADVIALVLPIAAIVLALRERRAVTGELSIGQAIATGVVVGLVSVPITAGFLWYYHHYMNPRWVDYLVSYQRTKMTAGGATADAIAQMEATQRSAASDGAQIFGALIGTTLVSIVISLIAGAIMRRKPAALSPG